MASDSNVSDLLFSTVSSEYELFNLLVRLVRRNRYDNDLRIRDDGCPRAPAFRLVRKRNEINNNII